METIEEAILDFQKNAPRLQKKSINPHFNSKYIGLEDLMEAVLPELSKRDLIWVTRPAQGPILKYELHHVKSKGKITGDCPLVLTKQDPQAFGSAITYARRQALMAVLGLVADVDDDANEASDTGHKRGKEVSVPRVPRERAERIRNLAEKYGLYEHGRPRSRFLAYLIEKGIEDHLITHINVDQADEVEGWLNEQGVGKNR